MYVASQMQFLMLFTCPCVMFEESIFVNVILELYYVTGDQLFLPVSQSCDASVVEQLVAKEKIIVPNSEVSFFVIY